MASLPRNVNCAELRPCYFPCPRWRNLEADAKTLDEVIGTAERTLILIFRQTKITTCKCLECKRTAETFGHQKT
ncbi:hypothetical protein NQ318_021304 [Aromia moschata]|uniref:Uncharacterized protein n=1 Tax=Aromia moschata TaxID=1265417 RepID=A0AAV8ZBP5_9CUCU|nr:hypothetical protein NQ318_021304 [Aromia moschata]